MYLKLVNYFLPIILIFSSLKIFGYIVSFIFFVPFIIKRKQKIIDFIYRLPNKDKIVLYYFYFQIIQSIIGSLVLKDIRIILYWIPYYFVCIYAFYNNRINYLTDKFYKTNLYLILYYSSLIYFILYFLFNIFSYFYFGNAYQIQDNLWAGSSTAFHISSILFISIFNLWKKNDFKLNSRYTFTVLFYVFLININDSQLGVLYLSTFLFFLSLRLINLRKFLNFILIFSLITSSYQISSYYVGFINSYVGAKKANIIDINSLNHFYQGSSSLLNVLKKSTVDYYKENKFFLEKDNQDKLSRETNRLISLLIAKEKFNESSLYVKLLGSGWYSSRVTVSDVNSRFAKEYGNKFENCPDCIPNKKVNQLQGIVAILLDTGLIGILFTFFLYFLTLKNIIIFNKDLILRFFYISLLLINFLCLFLGYPLNNIIYILFLLPNGLLNYK